MLRFAARYGVALDTFGKQAKFGGLVREILELAPGQLAARAVEALVHHRGLVARVLVAAVRSDVVALRNAPLVRCADLLVTTHGADPSLRRTPTSS